MATNPATVTDVENRWRPLTPDETTVANTLLDDAWVLLKHRDATVNTRLDAVPATLDVALVRMVLVAMVLRVLKNPEGLRQESLQDYSSTWDVAAASGRLDILDAELDLLAVVTAGDGGAFTIRPAYQVRTGSSSYVAADWEWVAG